jgi:hypothetical protein
MFFNEPKPHGFWPAKNCVAFCKISLSSLRMRPLTHASMCCQVIVSHAEAGHSLGEAQILFRNHIRISVRCDPFVQRRYLDIHLLGTLLRNTLSGSGSSATCLRVSPLVSAIRTASWRNSSVRFSPIVSLLWCSKCYQRSGIKPRQVHSRFSLTKCSQSATGCEWLFMFSDLQHKIRPMLGFDRSGRLNAKWVVGRMRPPIHVCFRRPLPSAAHAHTFVG